VQQRAAKTSQKHACWQIRGKSTRAPLLGWGLILAHPSVGHCTSRLPRRRKGPTPRFLKRPSESVRRTALQRRTALRRHFSDQEVDLELYRWRSRQFPLKHPYCQVWLAENNIPEEDAILLQGRAVLNGVTVSIPLSTEIHHKNKRRGDDLLDQEYWMAVSEDAHRKIESNKDWARAMNFLLPF
jgi:hypothetical protein